jgi:hypothetical protein
MVFFEFKERSRQLMENRGAGAGSRLKSDDEKAPYDTSIDAFAATKPTFTSTGS